MATPIMKQGPYLIAIAQAELTDQEWLDLQADLAGRIGRERSKGLVIDVSVLDIMDSFACRTLQQIAETARLRGAKAVIVGIQPDVAFSMVQLGLTLNRVKTALDLEEGLEFLDRLRGASRNGSR